MLYVSSIGAKNLANNEQEVVLTDSESGESFVVVRVVNSLGTYYLYNGKTFDMTEVLGYIKAGVIAVVDKTLISLMQYIDHVELFESMDSVDGSILVTLRNNIASSKDNVLFYLGARIRSIVDVVLYASTDKKFNMVFKSGKLVVRMGSVKYFVVYFCGEYVPYITKLITIYRDTTEFWGKVDNRGL